MTASCKAFCWDYVLGSLSLSIRGTLRAGVYCRASTSGLRAFAVLLIGILDGRLPDGICIGDLVKIRQAFGDDLS